MAGRTKLFAAFLAAVFTLSAACASPAGPEDPVLTLMIYMTGSDLESGNGAATIDIMEMLGTGTDPSKVNVILCTGGTKRWQGSIPNGGLCVWQVSGSDLHRLESLEQASMGNPGTLSMFLDYAANRFPARKYALILWNHGAGPMNGVCFDELFTENKMKDGLSLNELRRALADSPFSPEFPLEWIGFDACLMASVETAQTCAPYARYMIASQETEPWHGWNYRFLGGLSGDMTGEDAGKLISESYCGSGTEERGKLTLSCIRLDEMPAVAAAMEQLFSDLGTGLDAGSFPVIARGRRRAKSFGRGSTGSEYDLADLYSLAGEFEGIAPERAAALQEAVDRAVVLSEGCGED